jgi:hypothetical protein
LLNIAPFTSTLVVVARFHPSRIFFIDPPPTFYLVYSRNPSSKIKNRYSFFLLVYSLFRRVFRLWLQLIRYDIVSLGLGDESQD